MSKHEATESWARLNAKCTWCLKIISCTIEVIFLFHPLRQISCRRSFTVITQGGAVWPWTVLKVILIGNCTRKMNQFPLTLLWIYSIQNCKNKKIFLKSKCSGILWNNHRWKFKVSSVLPNWKGFHIVTNISLLIGSVSKRQDKISCLWVQGTGHGQPTAWTV
jgi:hypothetical protein